MPIGLLPETIFPVSNEDKEQFNEISSHKTDNCLQ